MELYVVEDVYRSYLARMFSWLTFGRIIIQIKMVEFFTYLPKNVEFILVRSVAKLIEKYVHTFRLFLFECVTH